MGVSGDPIGEGVRRSLDEKGFAVLEGLLSGDLIDALRGRFEGGRGAGERTGTRHVELDAKEVEIRPLLLRAETLAAVFHVVGRDFRLLVVNGRDPLPGFGQQGLHTDWLPRAPGDPYSVATVLWPLDDFTLENGATRLVPGSHLAPGPVSKAFADPAARHPDEELVRAPAGSALVLNGHLWHGGTRNRSSASRRAVQVQFVARRAAPPAPAPPLPPDLPTALRRILTP